MEENHIIVTIGVWLAMAIWITRVNAKNRSYYRGDYVDDIAWAWVRSIFLNPEELEEGYQLHQDQIEEKNEPLRQQLELANDLIAENQEKLDKLFRFVFVRRYGKGDAY